MVTDLKESEERLITHRDNKGYNKLLQQLSETDILVLVKKCTHLFQYVYESIEIHFKQWKSEVFYLDYLPS